MKEPEYKIPALTEVQKKAILKEFNSSENPDIIEITRAVFKNPALDGRTNEGKAVKLFLAEHGLRAKTSRDYVPFDGVTLTEEQKEFIGANCKKLLIKQIVDALWPGMGAKVNNLSNEYRAVQDFVKEINPEGVIANEVEYAEYKPPTTKLQAIRLINSLASENLREDGLSPHQAAGVGALIKHMRAPGYLQVANAYKEKQQRELFEAQYVRYTWDKPDLTAEDLNLYLTLCKEDVSIVKAEKMICILEEKLENLVNDENGKISLTLAETIKGYQDNKNKSIDRVRKLTDDLVDKRKERQDLKKNNNRSLAIIVEKVMNEEERQNLVKMAKLRKDVVNEEVKRFAQMDELEAKIFGLNPEDITR